MRNIIIQYELASWLKPENIFSIPDTTIQNSEDMFAKARSFGVHLKCPFKIRISPFVMGDILMTHRGKKEVNFTLKPDWDKKLVIVPLGLKLYRPQYMSMLHIPLVKNGLPYLIDKTTQDPYNVNLYLTTKFNTIQRDDLLMQIIPIVEEPYSIQYIFVGNYEDRFSN